MNISREIRRVAIPLVVIAAALVVLSQFNNNCFAAQSAVTHSRVRWKVYKNLAFGFSIGYPSSWKVDGGDEGNPWAVIYPRNPKPHEFYITIGTESRALDAVRAQFAEFTMRSPNSKFIEREIFFAGRKAYQFTRTDNPGYYGYTSRMGEGCTWFLPRGSTCRWSGAQLRLSTLWA